MLKNGIFCEMVILVVFKIFLVVKNLEIFIQIVPDSPFYYYLYDSLSLIPSVPGTILDGVSWDFFGKFTVGSAFSFNVFFSGSKIQKIYD